MKILLLGISALIMSGMSARCENLVDIKELLDGGNKDAAVLSITVPGENLTLAEKRDVYVIGSFGPGISQPGNMKMELFRGYEPKGAPIRIVSSSVDLNTGFTPLRSLEANYAYGAYRSAASLEDLYFPPPDLIKTLGGIRNPANKLIVTPYGFAGLFFGGATSQFEVDYHDGMGNPLEDLNAGTYTILVTGLSGQIAGATAAKTFWTAPTHLMLFRFSPPTHKQAAAEYAQSHNLIIENDPFPGYFYYNNRGYEIQNRWRSNNAIEVVNTLPGTVIDQPLISRNHCLLYNISESSTSNRTEIGTLIKNGFLELPETAFLHYDIGEPLIQYVNPFGEAVALNGNPTPFPGGSLIALTRAEMTPADGVDESGIYNAYETGSVKTLDADLSNGFTVQASQEFSLYGVARPISAEVILQASSHEYKFDNSIDAISYAIRNASGETVHEASGEASLLRWLAPGWSGVSIYEFRHEFELRLPIGDYILRATPVDRHGLAMSASSQELELHWVSGSEPPFDAQADINRDSRVDFKDLLRLRNSWHRRMD